MPFRFNAKYGLLTYAQCGELDPFQVVDMLSSKGAECIIGRENHQDGGTHLHAFFMFQSRVDYSSERVFDVEGHHPNILRGLRTPEAMYDYATKDGDIVAGGLERPESKRAKDEEKKAKYEYILEGGTGEEIMGRARDIDPGLYIRSYIQLRTLASDLDRKDPLDYVSPVLEWCTDQWPELERWRNESLEGSGIR